MNENGEENTPELVDEDWAPDCVKVFSKVLHAGQTKARCSAAIIPNEFSLCECGSCSAVFWCPSGACCDNALHLGDGLRLCPLWLRCSVWVSVLLSMMIQIWSRIFFFIFFSFLWESRGKVCIVSVTGAWTINAQFILCPWTRTRTWLRRRNQWPCTQTTCLPVASPTRICRWQF